jgi:hypothetical protein
MSPGLRGLMGVRLTFLSPNTHFRSVARFQLSRRQGLAMACKLSWQKTELQFIGLRKGLPGESGYVEIKIL